MTRRIVVGFDGSDHSRDALALAQVLAQGTGAELTAACVVQSLGEVPHPAFGEWHALMRDAAKKRAKEAESIVDDPIEARGIVSSSPARGLHDLAEEIDADAIVVGSSHRGSTGAAVAGTVGTTLLHGAPCSVAVAPAGFRDSERKKIEAIGVGYDGGPESEGALGGAIELARAMGACLRVITVAHPPQTVYAGMGYAFTGGVEIEEAFTGEMQEVLDRGVKRVPDDVEATGLLVTSGNETLADQRGLDLLVVGSRGWGPLRQVLLGSVSSHLVRSAPCPVIVFPRGAKAPLEGSRSDARTAAA